MGKLRIMTQNQWNRDTNWESWEKCGLDCSSAVRMKGHVRVFKELMPDVMGGQEVNKEMQIDFKFYCMEEGLNYTIIWGNMTPIIYRPDRLELLDNEYIAYPVKVEGYEGEFNDCRSKTANLAVFRSKEDGQVFIFLTTHLWWQNGSDPNHEWYMAGSDQVRTMQLKMAMDLIDKYQAKYGKCPVFLTGDLNTGYDSEAVQYAIKERNYFHAHDVATQFVHEGKGYNGCGLFGATQGKWEDAPFEEAIDHILVRDFPDVEILRFDRYTPEYYVYLSDHAPVFVDVEFKKSNNR